MYLVSHVKSSTSETKPFQSRSKAVPESKFSAKPGEKKAEPFQIEIAVLNCVAGLFAFKSEKIKYIRV